MMQNLTRLALRWTERGLVPDPLIRIGIRRLLKQRLDSLVRDDPAALAEVQARFVAQMDGAPIAPIPEKANEQHYEVPAEFFSQVLGRHRKYSSCYWRPGVDDLDTAEADALRITCEHAGLEDGQEVLELGCGWGSLTLWMAEHFPASSITAVSNSHSQRRYIMAQAEQRQLANLRIITTDMNAFSVDQQFDRVVSVEMFEHMRNYRELFRRVGSWLRADGRFFMHIFCHRVQPYEFVAVDDSDWMSRYFFSGGIMPSDALPCCFDDQMVLQNKWRWDGSHYQRTAEAWLSNMDERREQIMPILAATYGEDQVECWWTRWRIFFMACAELFGYAGGREWWVSHYLFAPAGSKGST